jgi:hypothetical protein
MLAPFGQIGKLPKLPLNEVFNNKLGLSVFFHNKDGITTTERTSQEEAETESF